MTEAEARLVAERYLSLQKYGRMATGRGVETPKSWIFETAAVGGELLLGNVPLIVNKRTEAVTPLRVAWREFVRDLTVVERLQRWWSRRRYY